MAIEISMERREDLVARLQAFFRDQFDEEISAFRTGELLEFVAGALGPHLYNQGVQDARRFMQQRLDDLDGEVHEPEGT